MSSKDLKWLDLENCVGEETGDVYTGSFLIKPFLTLAEKNDAARLAGRLTNGIFDEDLFTLYQNIAWLKFHIKDTKDADWWGKDYTNDKENSSRGDLRGFAALELYDAKPISDLSALVAGLKKRSSSRSSTDENEEKAEV